MVVLGETMSLVAPIERFQQANFVAQAGRLQDSGIRIRPGPGGGVGNRRGRLEWSGQRRLDVFFWP